MRRVWQSACAPVVCLVGMVILAISGCGGGTPPPSPPTPETTITTLGRLYGEYAARHDGVGPADEAAFRSFLESLPEAQRKGMGVEDVAAALVSPRDGQPYVILGSVDTREAGDGTPQAGGGQPGAPQQSGLQGQPVVIHEQTGQDGKRLVVTGFGTSAELDAAAFAKAVPE